MQVNKIFTYSLYAIIAFSLFYLTGHNFEKIIFPKLMTRLGFFTGIENTLLFQISNSKITVGSLYPILRILLITLLAYLALFLLCKDETNPFYYANVYLFIALFIFVISILASIIAPNYDFDMDKVKFLIRSPILLCLIIFLYKTKLFKNLT